MWDERTKKEKDTTSDRKKNSRGKRKNCKEAIKNNLRERKRKRKKRERGTERTRQKKTHNKAFARIVLLCLMLVIRILMVVQTCLYGMQGTTSTSATWPDRHQPRTTPWYEPCWCSRLNTPFGSGSKRRE